METIYTDIYIYIHIYTTLLYFSELKYVMHTADCNGWVVGLLKIQIVVEFEE